MRLFDTHCHIGLIHEDQIEQIITIQKAKKEGVQHIVSICNSISEWDKLYNNLRSARNVYHAVGVSPTESGKLISGWEPKVFEYAKKERVVAIGETGLDYVKNFGTRNNQVELFLKQLEIARTVDLPVIIHNRGAANDIYDILKTKIPDKGAIFHCYSEDWNFALKALDLNCYFSFAGNITYKNIKNLTETIKKLPEDRIVIESESPFLVPYKYKERRNKPEYLIETLNAVATLREKDPEEMAEIIYQNSLKAFNLPQE